MTMDTSEKGFLESVGYSLLIRDGFTLGRGHASSWRPRPCPDPGLRCSSSHATVGEDLGEADVPGRPTGQGTLPGNRSSRSDREAWHVLDVPGKGIDDLGCHLNSSGLFPAGDHARTPGARPPVRGHPWAWIRQVRRQRPKRQQSHLVLFVNGLLVITAELKHPAQGQMVEHVRWRNTSMTATPKEPPSPGAAWSALLPDTDLVFAESPTFSGGK